jgi:hypothetical protein
MVKMVLLLDAFHMNTLTAIRVNVNGRYFSAQSSLSPKRTSAQHNLWPYSTVWIDTTLMMEDSLVVTEMISVGREAKIFRRILRQLSFSAC